MYRDVRVSGGYVLERVFYRKETRRAAVYRGFQLGYAVLAAQRGVALLLAGGYGKNYFPACAEFSNARALRITTGIPSRSASCLFIPFMREALPPASITAENIAMSVHREEVSVETEVAVLGLEVVQQAEHHRLTDVSGEL